MPVKRYSSGMYLRLAFAVAAHLETEILLVDEILAVGDASFQKKCLSRIREDAFHGRTVLFVSHNLAAVTQLCGRAIWLDQGCVRYIGSPADAVDRYLAENSAGVAHRTWAAASAPGDDRVQLLAANFFDGVGTCLFSMADWRPNEFAAGDYTKRLRLPGQVFSEGRIEVLLQLVFYDPHVQSVVLPNALAFSTRDSAHPDSVRGPYKGAWPGVLRIRGDWTPAIPIKDNSLPHAGGPQQ
jgi:lipopolysaccharide transport system ATP-binding protein